MKKSYFLALLLFINTAFADNTSTFTAFLQTWQCENCQLAGSDFSHFSTLKNSQHQTLLADCSKTLSLSGSNLAQAIFDHANFTACFNQTKTHFHQIDFSNTDLTNANLNDSVFYGVSFTSANLPNAKLSRAQLNLSDFSQANFSHAHLDQVQSKKDNEHSWGSNFYETNFCGADLTQAQLYGYFRGANFCNTKLNGAVFSTAKDTIPSHMPELKTRTGAGLWSGANFKDADLTGAHFYDANGQSANLSLAKFCRTIMPDGTLNNRDCPILKP